MTLPQDQIAWLTANRARVTRYFFIPQLLVALLFLGFAHRTGRVHAHLLVQGAHTQGKIISFRSVRMSSSSGSRLSDRGTVNLPFIEFFANNHVVRFEEWKGSSSDPGVGAFVPVLYDPADTSVAMMDRGALNWLPWAPCFAIGALLALAGIAGLFSFLRFAFSRSASRSEVQA